VIAVRDVAPAGGASGCASLVTRHGTTLRLAHAIAVGFPSTASRRRRS